MGNLTQTIKNTTSKINISENSKLLMVANKTPLGKPLTKGLTKLGILKGTK